MHSLKGLSRSFWTLHFMWNESCCFCASRKKWKISNWVRNPSWNRPQGLKYLTLFYFPYPIGRKVMYSGQIFNGHFFVQKNTFFFSFKSPELQNVHRVTTHQWVFPPKFGRGDGSMSLILMTLGTKILDLLQFRTSYQSARIKWQKLFNLDSINNN
jgi:hypothetical protein